MVDLWGLLQTKVLQAKQNLCVLSCSVCPLVHWTSQQHALSSHPPLLAEAP